MTPFAPRAARLVVPLLLLAASPAAAAVPACEEGRMEHLQSALTGNRLIQAERMIATMQAGCAGNDRFAALHADWALRTGRFEQAHSLYAGLVQRHPNHGAHAAGAGRAAMRLGRYDEALALLTRATAAAGADWRAWNALGVLHDRRRDWAASAQAYERAAALAPYEASVWNNRGYSLVLQGQAQEALPLLDRALALDPNSAAIRRTRTLAYALTGRYDEARRAGESRNAWAQRLNNLGYAAWLAGDEAAARAFFARAIEASDTRFERAEHNLARLEGGE